MMKGFLLYLFIILRISAPQDTNTNSIAYDIMPGLSQEAAVHIITPMEALDLIQKSYAANFIKVYEGSGNQYYYKLASADYYLAYEGIDGSGKGYLIHLYEFVTDDPESGMGHTVTYGWYLVDPENGEIIEQIE